LKSSSIFLSVKSLNAELYLIQTKDDLPAFKSVTSGLIISPETYKFGGTSSTMKSFYESLLNCTTTSMNSVSGKQGNSILDLSVRIGHLTTLTVKGSFISLAVILPVIIRTNILLSSLQ